MATKAVPAGDRMTRRQFLSRTAAAAGCLALSAANGRLPLQADAEPRAPGPLSGARPSAPAAPTAAPPRVVHVFNPYATSWDYATGWYGDHVSQAEVDRMVDEGLMSLTGTSSPAAAWQALIPGYVPGERVAIKVNLNNATVADADNYIDALIEPVNRIIGGLTEMGVAESDIWVFDAARAIPDRFRAGCDYPQVNFSGRGVNDRGFSLAERVVFAPPAGVPAVPEQCISQVLVDAHYLVNMPIMKKHSHAHVTLSFKNHFGTIEQCAEVHPPVFPESATYTPDYNALVDIYRHPQFVGKTVLTVGDGLFASRYTQSSPPAPWITFGSRAPNSLFFSRDPVAIDCVMYDFLEAEAGVLPGADDYLVLAAQAGLGVFEHRAPGATDRAGWYSLIDYVYRDLWQSTHRVYVPSVQR